MVVSLISSDLVYDAIETDEDVAAIPAGSPGFGDRASALHPTCSNRNRGG